MTNQIIRKDKVFIFREGALGDVSIVSIIVYLLAKTYPNKHFTFLTNFRYKDVPSTIKLPNLEFEYIDFRMCSYKVEWLFNTFIKGRYETVINLQDIDWDGISYLHYLLAKDNITWGDISNYEGLTEYRNKTIDSTTKTNKPLIEVMADACKIVGLPINLNNFKSIFNKKPSINSIIKKETKWVGIAPSASTFIKSMPLGLFMNTIEELTNNNITVLLFGKGKREDSWFNMAKRRFGDKVKVVSEYSNNIATDLKLIANLDVMVCPDSSNGHMAALCGVPVITIWGSTTPKMGYTPFKQPNENQVVLGLKCQPCSTVGWKSDCELECKKSIPCLMNIKVKDIINKIYTIL